MARALTWSALTLDQVKQLQLDLDGTVEGSKTFRTRLAELLGFDLQVADRKVDLLLDFHFYNVAFAKVSCADPIPGTTQCVGILLVSIPTCQCSACVQVDLSRRPSDTQWAVHVLSFCSREPTLT